MKRLSYLLAAFAAMTALVACQVEKIEPETPVASVQGFTLTAGYGDPSSKVAFDAEGLDMKWIPGDILYMIDPNGSNRPIKLTTDITDSAKVAKFHTDEVVATGSFIVVNTQNTLDAQLEAYPTLKSSPSGLEDLIRVYGSVSVEKGQTSAEITLHQLYTMLSFNFSNMPDGFENGLNLGIAVVADGLPSLNLGKITADGLKTDYSGKFVYMLGAINAETQYSLIAPANLKNNKIIFFAAGSDAGSNRHVYEVFKDGVDLQAGKCYSISFDFAAESTKHVTLKHASGTNGLSLTNADDFLAAALIQWPNSLHLQADVDFSGECFLPLRTSNLQGNGHTLSFIQCGLAKCNYVGVVSDGNVHNLNVEVSIFSGANNVGTLCGRGYCESCKCSEVKVNGNDRVGGLVGYANGEVQNCSLHEACTVYGHDYVGGIVGQSNYNVSNCLAQSESIIVGGSSYIGGIAGSASGAVECGFEGRVNGEGSCIGGVTGEGQCTRCYCAGEVMGPDLVGGVSGASGCTDCYCIGEVFGGPDLSQSGTVAGISGTDAESPEVSGCYFFGTVSGGCGICMNTPAAELASTNLTSVANLYKETDRSLIDHCTIGTDGRKFVDYLDGVLNVNDAYYDLVWPDIAAGCPILKWQYEGFGVDLTIPGFDIVTL